MRRKQHFRSQFEKLNKNELGKKIIEKYKQYGLKIEIVSSETVGEGEIQLYKVRIKKGMRSQRFLDLEEEVRYSFKRPFQLFHAFKNSGGLFLAVSEVRIAKIDLWSIITSPSFEEHAESMNIPIIIGRNLRGEIIVEDLAKLIHLLVGGTTNSGKSVFLQSLISCILAYQYPNQVSLVLFDTGSNDLATFDGVDLLAHPVIQDIDTAVYAILALQAEMNRRYSERGDWPYIVCVADEASSLISNIEDKEIRDRVLKAFSDLLRRGRKAKIIWVLAAQDPTRENMKIELANITSRIAFRCAKNQNSITILDQAGAEDLEGSGDMLFKSQEHPNCIRLQGAYPEPNDMEELVYKLLLKPFSGTGKFIIPISDVTDSSENTEIIIEDNPPSRQEPYRDEKRDMELCDIILWALGRDTVSALQIIIHFKMSNRAGDIMRKLTDLGIVSEQVAKQPREVLCKSIDELSDKAIIFLTGNGVSLQTIEEAFRKNPAIEEADHD